MTHVSSRRHAPRCLTLSLPAACACIVLTASIPSSADSWLHACGNRLSAIAKRIPGAAWRAASSPFVWIPAGGALGIHSAGVDQNISSWASSATPVFGSRHTASDMSDHLRDAAGASAFVAAAIDGIGAASDGRYGVPLWNLAGGLGAITLTSGITGVSKEHTGRLRPNNTDTRSFPSGHTSAAAVHAMLASTIIGRCSLPVAQKRLLQTGCALLTAGTGWARVEGKHHYPTDVLMGAALGNFAALFFSELLAPELKGAGIPVTFAASHTGASVRVSLEF